jgi:hypothetical protein
MTSMISGFRVLTLGAVLTGTLALTACGGPEPVTTTTTERTTTTMPTYAAPPPSPYSSTTTTTRQVQP